VTLSQGFRTQSRSQLSRCGNGKATDAFTKHRRRAYRVNVAKETGRVQAKQSKHVKAKNEGKIIPAEFDNSKVQKLSCKTHSCDESANSSKNYKFIKEGQKQV